MSVGHFFGWESVSICGESVEFRWESREIWWEAVYHVYRGSTRGRGWRMYDAPKGHFECVETGWCQLFEKIFLWYCKPWDSELLSLYVNGRYYDLRPRLYDAPNEDFLCYIPDGTVGTFSSDISLVTLTDYGTSVFWLLWSLSTCCSASHPIKSIIGKSPDNQ